MKDQVSDLIVNHCVPHRLALTCGQADDEVAYLKKFKSILDQHYRFYQKSAERMAGLKAMQEVVNDLQLKLTQQKMSDGCLKKRLSIIFGSAYLQF